MSLWTWRKQKTGYLERSCGIGGGSREWQKSMQEWYRICKDSVTPVRFVVGMTDVFKVEMELHQELALSPFLLVMVMNRLTNKIRHELLWTT